MFSLKSQIFLKSLFIVIYICLIFSGGFLSLLENEYAIYFFPFTNWPMFDTYSSYHVGLIVYGKIEGSEKKIILPFEDFFPMNPNLINRGHGVGLTQLNRYGKKGALNALCGYIFKKYNQAPREIYLSTIEIKSRFWFLRDGEKGTKESLLVECNK